jgi:hypothetical protein
VPAIPNNKPIKRQRVKRSAPTNSDSSNTNNGVVVLIIEPSMAEVSASPNIMQSLRPTPISNAAPRSINLSLGSTLSGLSHNSGTSERSAAITNEAVTIAIGDIYVPSTRL